MNFYTTYKKDELVININLVASLTDYIIDMPKDRVVEFEFEGMKAYVEEGISGILFLDAEVVSSIPKTGIFYQGRNSQIRDRNLKVAAQRELNFLFN